MHTHTHKHAHARAHTHAHARARTHTGDARIEKEHVTAPCGPMTPMSHTDALARLSLRDQVADSKTQEEEEEEEESEEHEPLFLQKKSTWGLGGAAVL